MNIKNTIVAVWMFSTAVYGQEKKEDDFSSFQKKRREEQNALKKEREAGLQKHTDDYKAFRQKDSLRYALFVKKYNETFQKHIEDTRYLWLEFLNAQSAFEIDFQKGKGKVIINVPIRETKEEDYKKIEDAYKQVTENKGNATFSVQENNTEAKTIEEKPVLDLPSFSDIKEDKSSSLSVKEISPATKQIEFQFRLPDNYQTQRIHTVLPFVLKYSQNFNLSPAAVLSLIHIESNFNPKAYSTANAVGLMQLVPHSGAKDAYMHVYKKNFIPSAEMLFNPDLNIELGCGYLNYLQNVVFKDVKDDENRLLCSVAAYNTGPPNVKRSFGKNNPAYTNIINQMNVGELKNYFVKNLPYAETRGYIQSFSQKHQYYKDFQFKN